MTMCLIVIKSIRSHPHDWSSFDQYLPTTNCMKAIQLIKLTKRHQLLDLQHWFTSFMRYARGIWSKPIVLLHCASSSYYYYQLAEHVSQAAVCQLLCLPEGLTGRSLLLRPPHKKKVTVSIPEKCTWKCPKNHIAQERKQKRNRRKPKNLISCRKTIQNEIHYDLSRKLSVVVVLNFHSFTTV